MKKTTKALLTVLCAVMLVVASVMGTMAYLTSKDSVKNTFTVGKVGITLDEADVKTDGTYETNVNARVDANEYKLIPGHEYIKDPIVHVTNGSEDCWLFVKVDNGIEDIEATGSTTIAAQMAANGWTLVDDETNVYSYKKIVEANADVNVFGTFTVADNADVAKYETAEINVTAYAIQADGFDTAAAAWTAAGLE